MHNDFELGYTPRNLRLIRSRYGLTQREVARLTGTASYRTVAKWEADLNSGVQRADMPLKKWLMLLNSIRNFTEKYTENDGV